MLSALARRAIPADRSLTRGEQTIKEALGVHGEIRFVDYQRGDPEGYVRFVEPVGATTCVAAGTEPEINGEKATLVFLEGEAEETCVLHSTEH